MASLAALGGAVIPGVISGGGMSAAMSGAAGWGLGELMDKEKLSNQRDSNRVKLEQAQVNADRELKELEAQTAKDEEDRRKNLRSIVAKQRASFASSGISSYGGSSGAVLKGLLNESEEEKSFRDKMDGFKKQAINDSITHQKQINLLELSQAKSGNMFF